MAAREQALIDAGRSLSLGECGDSSGNSSNSS
eukprot:CAMPEP_0172898968 /NCGR_PEP_ID=MMETSP1075-20121228/160760_1 /TAXON_ID=2916 /ORGANISM="Ceratium fusus, Strain PA161109" /LENGTH=31 /DNA_ID= /DNA_START= /DNA_END= /DNA_ORIENTATION=